MKQIRLVSVNVRERRQLFASKAYEKNIWVSKRYCQFYVIELALALVKMHWREALLSSPETGISNQKFK